MPDSMSSNRGAASGAAEEMLRAIPDAGLDYLKTALAHPDVSEEHVALIVKNRAADSQLLSSIAANPRWNRAHTIRRGLVRNPKTPGRVALKLAAQLFWRDLAEVVEDGLLAAPLRKTAEKFLFARIPDLTIGEQISLARICGRFILTRLLEETDTRVLDAALWNGKLTEPDVVTLVQRSGVAPSTLDLLTRHPRWREHYAVKLNIARHAHAPLSASLGLLTSLSPRDLAMLTTLPEIPTIVKLAAERVLAARRPVSGDTGERDRHLA